MTMAKQLPGRVRDAYALFSRAIFYIFMFGTLSYGRAFSVLHVDTALGPVFVTEIFLILSLPLLVIRRHRILKAMPTGFLWSAGAFFFMGCVYLGAGLLGGNIFSARDVTLCGYMLFIPITLAHLESARNIRHLLVVVALSITPGIFSGLCTLLQWFPSIEYYNFASQAKTINFGLFYGISIALLSSFFYGSRPRWAYDVPAAVLLALNFFMIAMFGKKAIWLSITGLIVFLGVCLKGEFFRRFVASAAVFIVLCSGVSYYAYATDNRFLQRRLESVYTEVRCLITNFQRPTGPVSEPPIPRIDYSKIRDESDLWSALRYRAFFEDPETAASNIVWRFDIWRQTFEFAMKAPFIGHGFGVYPDYEIWGVRVSPKSAFMESGVVPAHNDILAVFMKMGLVGLGLYLFFNVHVFVYGLSRMSESGDVFIRRLLVFALGSILYWHLFAFFFDVIDSPPTNVVLWVLMGLVFSVVGTDNCDAGYRREFNE